jgi:hypothetical protein
MEQIYEFSFPKIFGATYKLPPWPIVENQSHHTQIVTAPVNANVGLQSKKVSGASALHRSDFSVSLVTRFTAERSLLKRFLIG